MAFKLNNPPYTIDNTPIYHVDMEDGVMGKANCERRQRFN